MYWIQLPRGVPRWSSPAWCPEGYIPLSEYVNYSRWLREAGAVPPTRWPDDLERALITGKVHCAGMTVTGSPKPVAIPPLTWLRQIDAKDAAGRVLSCFEAAVNHGRPVDLPPPSEILAGFMKVFVPRLRPMLMCCEFATWLGASLAPPAPTMLPAKWGSPALVPDQHHIPRALPAPLQETAPAAQVQKPISPGAAAAVQWMGTAAAQGVRLKRDTTIRECCAACKEANTTYRDARAAWDGLPQAVRRKRGAPKKADRAE